MTDKTMSKSGSASTKAEPGAQRQPKNAAPRRGSDPAPSAPAAPKPTKKK